MALAPRRLLFGVPSSVIIVSSILTCASASMPPTASKISPLTASTALRTPLPRYRALSPSRSSTASCAPVEAPDGTAARPSAPSSSTTSTSTVGLPRLSKISRPIMSTMAVMVSRFCFVRSGSTRWPRARKGHRRWHHAGSSSNVPLEHPMSYVQKVLQPGEEVRYQASIHWITYLHGALWLLAAVVVSIVMPAAWRDGFLMMGVRIVLVAVGLYFLARAWFDWWITEIAVTNRRVIYKRGFISRTTAEMHMDKIVSVKVDQSILGRILNYGKVTIVGTGGAGSGEESLGTIDEPIAAPLDLRNHI